MKKCNFFTCFFLLILIFPSFIFSILPSGFVPKEESSASREIMPDQSVMNINNMSYWIRLESDELVNYTGGPIQELILQLSEGWNLISGISVSVPVENIIDPQGIIIEGTIYQFDGGYSPESEIKPGRAIWVRSIVEGEIIVQILY